MKLENQVCNLELAKKIKELGVGQDSLWCWWDDDIIPGHLVPLTMKSAVRASAFTVAELGEMLPFRAKSEKIAPQYTSLGQWKCSRIYKGKLVYFYGKTEADVRAKMLIYLIENKLMEV